MTTTTTPEAAADTIIEQMTASIEAETTSQGSASNEYRRGTAILALQQFTKRELVRLAILLSEQDTGTKDDIIYAMIPGFVADTWEVGA